MATREATFMFSFSNNHNLVPFHLLWRVTVYFLWKVRKVVTLNLAKHSKKTRRFLTNRSSRPEVFCKNCVLKNFTKLPGMHLYQSLSLIKLQISNFIKKRLWHRYFPVNFAKFLRTQCLYRMHPVAASEQNNSAASTPILCEKHN